MGLSVACFQEKQKDKEDAQKYNHIHTATFDLEAVLPTPCSLVSQAYYKRKLSSYNFTFMIYNF
jgi:hypothetical protein